MAISEEQYLSELEDLGGKIAIVTGYPHLLLNGRDRQVMADLHAKGQQWHRP